MPKESKVSGKIKLAKVRLSYPSLFTPTSYKGSAPRYSATFLLDKVKDKKAILAIKKAMKAVATEKWADKIPKRMELALRDGEEKEDTDGYGDGIMFIAAHAQEKSPPKIVDDQLNFVKEEDNVFYSGCYVNASITVWAMDNEWGKRIACSLNAVMFAKDGDPFSGERTDVEEEFSDLVESEDEDEDDNLLG